LLKNTLSSWGSIAKSFHWIIAFLIFTAMVLGLMATEWPLSPEKLSLFVWHKTVGISILLLVCLRIIWKLTNVTPASPLGMSKTNDTFATLGHYFLYFLLFAMPVSGWILNSAANFPFQYLGLFDFPSITSPDKSLQEKAELAHFVLFWILLATVLGHGGMAVMHHYRHGNNILTRMLPEKFEPLKFLGMNVMLLVIVSGAMFVAMNPNKQSPGTEPKVSVEEPVASEIIQAEVIQTEVIETEIVSTVSQNGTQAESTAITAEPDNLWDVIYDQSELGFTGLYFGAEFNGLFESFEAIINFDPDAPETGHFDVTIDTTTINTFSSDRDDVIGDSDWFYFNEYPVSTYKTKTITKLGDGSYSAIGELDLKGNQKDIELRFTWTDAGEGQVEVNGQARMLGEADIKRTDFDIGNGAWVEDDSIGFDVWVKVELLLQRQ
jgi:cytochrome b561